MEQPKGWSLWAWSISSTRSAVNAVNRVNLVNAVKTQNATAKVVAVAVQRGV
jgi:hypothetical protein